MDLTKINLDAPAFGDGAETPEMLEQKSEPIEPSVEATTEESKPEEVQEEVSDEKPNHVPYSRFKKFHDKAEELEKQVEYLSKVVETIKTKEEAPDLKLPDYWVEMYGDSDASKRAFELQTEQNEQLKREAREEAIRAVREEQYKEKEALEENVKTIDNNFAALSEYLGRDLTEKEESALLDIVDDYTPKNDDGTYNGALLPFEKAWEIYELKQQAAKAPTIQGRNKVAGLTSSGTQGEPSVDPEKNKNWNPLDWNAWKNRL